MHPGDWMTLMYWRPFPMPERPNNGTWETAPVRVVAGGPARAAVEVTNQSVLASDAPSGSFLRFVDPGDLFTTTEAAEDAARTRPSPSGA